MYPVSLISLIFTHRLTLSLSVITVISWVFSSFIWVLFAFLCLPCYPNETLKCNLRQCNQEMWLRLHCFNLYFECIILTFDFYQTYTSAICTHFLFFIHWLKTGHQRRHLKVFIYILTLSTFLPLFQLTSSFIGSHSLSLSLSLSLSHQYLFQLIHWDWEVQIEWVINRYNILISHLCLQRMSKKNLLRILIHLLSHHRVELISE